MTFKMQTPIQPDAAFCMQLASVESTWHLAAAPRCVKGSIAGQ